MKDRPLSDSQVQSLVSDDATRLTRRSLLGAVGVALLVEACGGAAETQENAPDGAPGVRGATPEGGAGTDGGTGAIDAGGANPGNLDGGAQDGGAQDGGAQDGSAQDGSAQDGGAQDGSAQDGATQDSGPVSDPSAIPESSSFPLGVSAGDATDTAAILWTRYSGSAALELRVWEMSGDTYVRQVFAGAITPADGGFVHHDVTGLSAGLRYRYGFFEMTGGAPSARSPLGRFRAALAPTTLAPVTIGAVSCTLNLFPKTTLERAGTRTDLDTFLLLGDTTYNDGCTTRTQYRDRWGNNLGANGYKALRASTSLLQTWDDHEVDNDWNPETIAPAKLATAFAAFFEHAPLRRIAGAPNRIWRKRSWGKTLDLFVLDCRSERLPSTRGTPQAQYISRAQMDWLKSELAASTAVFKAIVNSVPITTFPPSLTASATDRWEGYAAQRTEILQFIDTTVIPGVLWIAGDFHVASMGRVSTSGPGQSAIEVLVGPGAQIGDPLATSLGAPQFDWASMSNNYTTFAFDPTARTVRVQYHGSSGSLLKEKTYTFP